MRNYTLYIYHIICQRRHFHINTITNPHKRSVFYCTAKLFILATAFHFACGYEPTSLFERVNNSIEPTLKSKACLKCLYFTKIISALCCYLEYFSYLYTVN